MSTTPKSCGLHQLSIEHWSDRASCCNTPLKCITYWTPKIPYPCLILNCRWCLMRNGTNINIQEYTMVQLGREMMTTSQHSCWGKRANGCDAYNNNVLEHHQQWQKQANPRAGKRVGWTQRKPLTQPQLPQTWMMLSCHQKKMSGPWGTPHWISTDPSPWWYVQMRGGRQVA